MREQRDAGPTLERSSTVNASRKPEDGIGAQKFGGNPSLRRAMMFFWISDVPPPIVSITV